MQNCMLHNGMYIWQDALGRPVPPELAQGSVITIGNFDGVHRGHRRLIDRAKDLCRTLSQETGAEVPLLILTFWPHSGERVGKKIQRIYTEEQKDDLLHSAAPEAFLVQLEFTDEVRSMEHQRFFEEVLLGRYRTLGLAVGEDFRFGYQGRGCVETLREECGKAGIAFKAVPDLMTEGPDGQEQRVSSTLIRELLAEGDVSRAGDLLGVPYYAEGTVQYGKRLGRQIGFPTANLMLPEGLAEPRHGVYRTRVTCDSGTFTGVTNLGLNPTVEHGHAVKIETHLVDFEGDLYGRTIRIEFLEWLRPEQKFPSVEALREQLKKDIDRVRSCGGSIGGEDL